MLRGNGVCMLLGRVDFRGFAVFWGGSWCLLVGWRLARYRDDTYSGQGRVVGICWTLCSVGC